MFLKRHYDPESLKNGAPKVTHVDVRTTPETQKFTPRIVEKGRAEGWMTITEHGEFVIRTGEGEDDVVYAIIAPPGRYCCHCGAPLSSERQAKAHVADKHGGEDSPSAENPSGYARHNFYLCELA